MEQAWPAHARGSAGEIIACAFLRARGYAIHAHNLRVARCEFDVLARRGEVWVVVEVKWRRAGDAAGGAQVAWRAAQRRRAASALLALRAERDPEGRHDWRLDLIAIEERADGLTLTHHRAAAAASGSFW